VSQTETTLSVALADRYRIERELGRGGMASVYLARDLKHDRSVALKVLDPDLGRQLGAERFLQEIRLTARLTHPHILPVLDSGADSGRLWYTMPYVKGESLRDRLRREVQLPIETALEIARQAALALEYAHNEGVVHRDVKPANVLLSGDQAFVADFGLAKAIRSVGDEFITGTGLAVGTPAYMAPEQANGDPVDARTDVYALACVLYEMIAGEPPFTGRTPQAIMARRVAGQVSSLRAVRPSVARTLDDAILKALSPVRADRFASAAELAAALGAHPTADVETRSARPAAPRLRRSVLTGLAAIGLAGSGYVALHAIGFVPPATLLSRGVLKEREPVLVADFQSGSSDSLIGLAATEAFRTDLSQSSVVTIVTPAELAPVLERMRRPPGSPLDPTSAREVAVRQGIRAVVTGEIAAVAGSYLVSVQLVSPAAGTILVALRERAAGGAEVIPAIDRLSRRLRQKIGESLKVLRAEPPLESVTTSSLEALRKYSLATSLAVGRGDFAGAIPLLEQAVALDTGFAMGYRALGTYRGMVGDRAGQVADLTAAFRHRDRLPDREAALTEASYFDMVTHDADRAIASYRRLLAEHPEDRTALINVALLYANRDDYATAESLEVRVLALDSTRWIPYLNLIYVQVARGKPAEARRTVERAMVRFPGLPQAELQAIAIETSQGNYSAGERMAREFEQRHRGTLPWGVVAQRRLAEIASVRGRLAEAEARLADAMAVIDPGQDTLGYLDLAIDRAQIDIRVRGERRRGLQQIDRALSRYRIRSLPPVERPYLSLAYAYAVAGHPAPARQLVAQYLGTIEPILRFDTRYIYYSVLGEIAMAEHRPADALVEFRQNARICPICGLADIGRAYDALGVRDSSVAYYEQYLATRDIDRLGDDAGRLAQVYKRLGELHARRGDRSKARDYYVRFVELWKDCDADLRPQVMEVRRRIGKLEAAAAG
jgi:eukaryotic-like serine/threonine-protein kinase